MDLNEFRNKMSSDATEENKRLKAELSKLKKQYREKVSSLKKKTPTSRMTAACWVIGAGRLQEELCVGVVPSAAVSCANMPRRWKKW